MSVVLHIGWHKTGTTSIQYWLRDHEALLSEYGVRFPRGWLRLNNHFELPLTLMDLGRMMAGRTRGDEWRDPEWRARVLEQVLADLARHRGEITVLSAEDLCLFRLDSELCHLRNIVGDAHVLAYVRDPADFRASMAAHLRKAGMPGLSDDPDAYNYLGPGTWRTDYRTLLGLWRRWFSQVTVIDYDDAVRVDGSVLPSFLRFLEVPAPASEQLEGYRLNARSDPVPRAEGNRLTTGRPFGC